MAELAVPDPVRQKARTDGAGWWLDALPGLLAELARDWSVTVGRAYRDSTEAYVTEATLPDGTPAVLKLLVPRAGDHAADEITVLRLAGGTGCVRLLRADEARDALLLERLGPSLFDLKVPIERRLEILCTVAGRVWRPAPDCGLRTGAVQASRLAELIARTWDELGRPCSERAVAQALACAQRRVAGHDDERAVLVHGDVHQWNTLRAGDDYKLVDPDGLLAEPECDLGVLMREDPLELLRGDPRDRARQLAARTGLDAAAIWEWGVLDRVSDGLLCLTDGLETFGRELLAVADRIATQAPESP